MKRGLFQYKSHNVFPAARMGQLFSMIDLDVDRAWDKQVQAPHRYGYVSHNNLYKLLKPVSFNLKSEFPAKLENKTSAVQC
jgi:hypothetical protein